jgi:D-serine deaminase-like pyridoxal phosphate-dependent protein
MDGITESHFLSTITRPTLLLDEARVRHNIARMVHKARNNDVRLRAHFKTHQSSQVGSWCHELGIKEITVSSVKMAEYFASHGWDDITIAFPVNWREIEVLNRLAKEIHLGLLVESPETVDFLAQNLKHPVDIWLDVDAGYHRTGIAWDDVDRAREVVEKIQASSLFTLKGMLTHNGNSYSLRTTEAIQALYDQTVERFSSLREKLDVDLELSIGDTPTCSILDDFRAVDEIRPGNFVYYDVMQVIIGSCTWEDVAVALACPVVAKYPERNEIVIHGGGVHLSKDSFVDKEGRLIYGMIALPQEDGWGSVLEGSYVKSLSQEHGVIVADDETFERVQVGSLVMVLPVHSCMTADLMKSYITLTGNTIRMMV